MPRVYTDRRGPRTVVDKTTGAVTVIPPAWIIDYVGRDGRRRRERTPATTKGEAMELLREKMSAITKATIAGLKSTESLKPLTFTQFYEQEFEPHVKATLNKSTYDGYVCQYRIVKGAFGTLPLRSIDRAGVQRFFDR